MKTGRKQRHHVASDGTQIKGLSKQPDGRWRIIGTAIRYSEPDETKAIERFYRLTKQKRKSTFISVARSIDPPVIEDDELDSQSSLVFIEHDDDTIEVGFDVDTDVLWRYFAQEIKARPLWVAEKTGDERLGYLDTVQPRKPLPSLDFLEQEWKDNFTCSKEQMKKVLKSWEDFRTTSGIVGLKDITPEVCVQFKRVVNTRKISHKFKKHIFSDARRLLSFAKDQAIAVEEITTALNSMKLMKADREPVSLDPKPISVEDWRALLKVAKGPDRAMILLMLNAALYVKECMALEWSDIRDGCLITNREKTGKCIRAAQLWPETINALNAIERKGDYIFLSYAGAKMKDSGTGSGCTRPTQISIAGPKASN